MDSVALVVGKRKRTDADAPSSSLGTSPLPPRHTSQKPTTPTGATGGAGRLEFITNKIEDLANIITLGGCPVCGSTECRRSGKLRNRAVQKYTCRGCQAEYHELKNSREEKTYRDRSFDGKRKLQALVHHAYGELTKIEMEKDQADFEQTMASLQCRLREKRRNISKLLGISLGDDFESWDQTSKNIGDVPSNQEPKSNNPFRETMLLLRRGTPKLEQTVARLLTTHRGNNPPKNHEHVAEEGEFAVDVVNDHPKSSPKFDGKYQLSSRIMQDGGEEIEIFEKCAHDHRRSSS